MSDALVNLSELGIKKKEEEDLSVLTKASDYLPQLRVGGANTTFVKEGKVQMGHLALYFTSDKVVDISEQIDVLVIDYRSRASILITGDQPINYYNFESSNFQEVLARSKSNEGTYTAGLEYLIYIPSVNQFALFFMGTPTLRRESGNVKSLCGKAATFKIKLIKTKKYSWHGVECFSCDTPFDIPPKEEIIRIHEKYFANPEDSDVDIADSEVEESRAR